MDIPDFQQQPQQTVLTEPKSTKLKKYLPIGIGALISIAIVVLAFGVLQNFFTRASGVTPQNVVVSDQTQNTAKITWMSEVETLAMVEYGTSPNALTFKAPEAEKTKNHSVELTLLSPNTTYYYQISVGDKKFDNGGIPWTFTTKDILQTQPLPTEITPTQKIASTTPTLTPTTDTSVCKGVDCAAIKAKIGKGCSTRDYFVCQNKLSGTPTR
jgi:hypothetical protein